MNEAEMITTCDPLLLVQALMHGGKVTEARLDAAMAEVGLSSVKWGALRHLVEAGEGMPLGQLADKLACVRSNVTQLVDRMVAEKLVQRTPDPEDRRSIRAELTPLGRQRYEAGLVVMHQFERQLLGEYTPEERILLSRVLERLGQS